MFLDPSLLVGIKMIGLRVKEDQNRHLKGKRSFDSSTTCKKNEVKRLLGRRFN